MTHYEYCEVDQEATAELLSGDWGPVTDTHRDGDKVWLQVWGDCDTVAMIGPYDGNGNPLLESGGDAAVNVQDGRGREYGYFLHSLEEVQRAVRNALAFGIVRADCILGR